MPIESMELSTDKTAVAITTTKVIPKEEIEQRRKTAVTQLERAQDEVVRWQEKIKSLDSQLSLFPK